MHSSTSADNSALRGGDGGLSRRGGSNRVLSWVVLYHQGAQHPSISGLAPASHLSISGLNSIPMASHSALNVPSGFSRRSSERTTGMVADLSPRC